MVLNCQHCGIVWEGGSTDPTKCALTPYVSMRLPLIGFALHCCNCYKKKGWEYYDSHGCVACKARLQAATTTSMAGLRIAALPAASSSSAAEAAAKTAELERKLVAERKEKEAALMKLQAAEEARAAEVERRKALEAAAKMAKTKEEGEKKARESPSQWRSPVPFSQRNFAISNFKMLYSRDEPPPTQQHEVFGSLYKLLLASARCEGRDERAAVDHFKRVEQEVLRSAEGLDDALSEAARLAQRIWTSDQVQMTKDGRALEVCSVLNAMLRADEGELLEAAMPLMRAINRLCVVRGVRPDALIQHPPDHVCYRGGGLPDSLRGFFAPGTAYRVPGYLAASFSREVADGFAYKAFEEAVPCVMWIIHVDPRGATNIAYRCKQVNYVKSSKFGDEEQEYLWAPYSVFTVVSLQAPAGPRATYLDPHLVHLRAAIDNRLEPEDLPLAPWY